MEEVTIADELFRLELAVDEASRRNGLSGREELEPDLGMLFIYPDARPRSFWMYDCAVDIDLLYLDEAGRIVARHGMKSERPRGAEESDFAYQSRLRRYRSRRPAQFVVELAPGTIRRLELRPGQLIKLDLERLKKLAQ